MWALPSGMQLGKPQMLTLIQSMFHIQNEVILLKKLWTVFLGKIISYSQQQKFSNISHSIDIFPSVKRPFDICLPCSILDLRAIRTSLILATQRQVMTSSGKADERR